MRRTMRKNISLFIHSAYRTTYRNDRPHRPNGLFILESAAIAALLLIGTASDLTAQVYKTQNKDGKIVYSSKAPAKGAKPAQLPNIMRGEVKIAASSLQSCDKHGGINCQNGADTDGSVICYDGFRGAAARFRFSCNAPKLEITGISDPDEAGAFTVFVRNSRSVKASGTTLSFKMPNGTVAKLSGPTQIDANGIAEYRHGGGLPQKLLIRPDVPDIAIGCANCP